MSAGGDPSHEPLGQGEIETLHAELRAALQHQRAAVERVKETQAEVEALMRRARELLNLYHIPSTFHHASPTVPQISMYASDIRNPTFHHRPVVT